MSILAWIRKVFSRESETVSPVAQAPVPPPDVSAACPACARDSKSVFQEGVVGRDEIQYTPPRGHLVVLRPLAPATFVGHHGLNLRHVRFRDDVAGALAATENMQMMGNFRLRRLVREAVDRFDREEKP